MSTTHLENIRRTTVVGDGTPTTNMYLAVIDVMAARADGVDDIIRNRAPGGPIVSWVKDTIIDIELLGGGNHPRAIY